MASFEEVLKSSAQVLTIATPAVGHSTLDDAGPWPRYIVLVSVATSTPDLVNKAITPHHGGYTSSRVAQRVPHAGTAEDSVAFCVKTSDTNEQSLVRLLTKACRPLAPAVITARRHPQTTANHANKERVAATLDRPIPHFDPLAKNVAASLQKLSLLIYPGQFTFQRCHLFVAGLAVPCERRTTVGQIVLKPTDEQVRVDALFVGGLALHIYAKLGRHPYRFALVLV